MKMKNIRTFLILPICLLILNAIEEVIIYKLQSLYKQNLLDKFTLTGILVLMFAAGFSIVGNSLAPRAKKALEKGHKSSKKNAGIIGISIFYGALFTAIFVTYYVIYVLGPEFMLPKEFR